MKKIVISFLVFMLILNCCFVNAKAAELAGDGTKDNPYIITNAEELKKVSKNLGSYFILNNDIDLSNVDDFLPIGNNTTAFTGNFNGNGKKITGLSFSFLGYAYDKYEDLQQNTGSDYEQGSDSGWTGDYETGQTPKPEDTIVKIPKYVGLFGVNAGSIYDLHIENANISANALNEEIFVGVFCGVNKGEIYRCYSSVSNVTASANSDYCGGIIGKNETTGVVGNCFSNATVKANLYAGGLVGLNSGYVACSFYNGFDVDATHTDAVCNNTATSQYNYYLESYLTSATATKLTSSEFAYSSYFKGFSFNSAWRINSVAKQPELKNNPYPTKSMGQATLAPEIESAVGKIVTLKTDGKTLFSNDGVRYSKNNVFTQEIGTTVKYYAKKAETVNNYIGMVSPALEFTNSNLYDVNLDGFVNNADIITLRRYLAGWEMTLNLGNLDINGDTQVNNGDAIYFSRYLSGWYN